VHAHWRPALGEPHALWWKRIFPTLAFLAVYTVGIITQFLPVPVISALLDDGLLQVTSVLILVGVVGDSSAS